MLCSLTPFRLATSAIGLLSASRKIRTICSSLYRLFFMLAPCLGAIFSNFRWSENTQAGQKKLRSTDRFLVSMALAGACRQRCMQLFVQQGNLLAQQAHVCVQLTLQAFFILADEHGRYAGGDDRK